MIAVPTWFVVLVVLFIIYQFVVVFALARLLRGVAHDLDAALHPPCREGAASTYEGERDDRHITL